MHAPVRSTAVAGTLTLALLIGLTACDLVPGSPDGEPVTPSATANDSSPATDNPATDNPTPSADSPTLPTGVPGPPRDIVTGLDVPWSVAALPDGSALVSLRDEARVVRVRADGSTSPVRAPGADGTVPDIAPAGEGGLLGLAVSPDFEGDHAVFSYATTDRGNEVTRWRLEGDTLVDPRPLVTGIAKAGNHNGGRLAFGPDGMLYVSTGDATNRDAAQDPGSLSGKILRITADGEPAPGNPFPGSPVWSLGHRNVQGLGWAADGTMYASEFGQDRFDELNLITPGGNYGWPSVEGSDGEGGFIDPLVTWPVAEASPSGLLVTGDAVYLAALRGRRLWRVPLVDGAVGPPQALLADQLGRLRDVVLSPDRTALWVLTSNTFRGTPRAGDDRLVELPLTPG